MGHVGALFSETVSSIYSKRSIHVHCFCGIKSLHIHICLSSTSKFIYVFDGFDPLHSI